MTADSDCFPPISTVFELPKNYANSSLYCQAIRNMLAKILPQYFDVKTIQERGYWKQFHEQFHDLLPLITSCLIDKPPGHISFFVLSRYRANSFKFFFDMIGNWLVPGKKLNLVLTYAADFRVPDFGQSIYTICEVMIHVDSEEELEQIQNNLPIIETELRLGMKSSYYARRILEIKGLTADAKTASIQENIAYLVARLPKYFDYDLLTEMQHVLVMSREDFKAIRDCRHLSRIISIHYLFRKDIRELLKKAPEKRYLHLKLFQANLHTPSGSKKVLGVLVGLNFFGEKEIFEKRHLLNAIKNLFPQIQAVENSFFTNRRGNEHINTLYMEIEKTNGAARWQAARASRHRAPKGSACRRTQRLGTQRHGTQRLGTQRLGTQRHGTRRRAN